MRILVFTIMLISFLASCQNSNKETESIISNQTNKDFTIYFSAKGSGYYVASQSKKTVNIETKLGNELAYPFDSDTVRVKVEGVTQQFYFAKGDINEADNIFNTNNWTYLTNSAYYTKATYSFTESILNSMREY